MKNRSLTITKEYSTLLFGMRGAGKSTLLKQAFTKENALWIDLLEANEEKKFSNNPDELIAIVKAMPDAQRFIIIDEIQKIPKLLDIVHKLIESTDKLFILTGSSARKLKHGSANLLAGRAFVEHLFPFTFKEIENEFDLKLALKYGMLPKIWNFKDNISKEKFLYAYANTYLKEEIWTEQLIRKLEPFRKFLQVAAQCDGEELSFAKIARDTQSNINAVQNYYSILEDTLIGFHLEAFQHSFRKRLGKTPKFYFLDIGVSRALAQMVETPIAEQTSYYGELFERFVILECYKLARYHHPNFQFSYMKFPSGGEIDLVIERPGQPLLLIEIKSATEVSIEKLRTLRTVSEELGDCEAICLCQEKRAKQYENISILPWQEGIKKYFS